MANKQNDRSTTDDHALAARRARMLVELTKATLAQLHPDDAVGAAADAAFDRALNRDAGQ